eukprot:TRINITY_DN20764_c0_g1_i1.p1 TRINITY_DN20764_c0_g1~~TRINITY_DN20764_c0_g1_i1.p1  ORF type:complete len:282 (+),score=68.77 TRINITY_DN20764_c0_g1_i1:239-1084(+)
MSTPRLAATVLVVRQSQRAGSKHDFEVLMVKRSPKSRFMPNAHVFPGGITEPSDYSYARSEVHALKVGAVREVFEETGVLLATPPAPHDKAHEWRSRLQKNAALLQPMCEDLAISLDTQCLYPWSHWITPEEEKYRYDTFFFIAIAPPGCLAACDESETVKHDWFDPSYAIERHSVGDISLPPPTWLTLVELSAYATRSALIEAAEAGRDMTPILPRSKINSKDDGTWEINICLPGDAEGNRPASAQARRRLIVTPTGIRYESDEKDALPMPSAFRSRSSL